MIGRRPVPCARGSVLFFFHRGCIWRRAPNQIQRPRRQRTRQAQFRHAQIFTKQASAETPVGEAEWGALHQLLLAAPPRAVLREASWPSCSPTRGVSACKATLGDGRVPACARSPQWGASPGPPTSCRWSARSLVNGDRHPPPFRSFCLLRAPDRARISLVQSAPSSRAPASLPTATVRSVCGLMLARRACHEPALAPALSL